MTSVSVFWVGHSVATILKRNRKKDVPIWKLPLLIIYCKIPLCDGSNAYLEMMSSLIRESQGMHMGNVTIITDNMAA